MPRSHLIVVADAAEARIFEQPRYQEAPTLIHEMTNPEGRRRTSEIVSDRMGYKGNHPQNWRQSVPQQSDPAEVEEERFARQLADYIDAQLDGGAFSTISLFTPAPLLGKLRKQLSRRAEQNVIQEEATDLKNVPTTQLVERLRELIPPRPIR
jgi:protein required for attachment to host cells